jgi:hypothetical protein
VARTDVTFRHRTSPLGHRPLSIARNLAKRTAVVPPGPRLTAVSPSAVDRGSTRSGGDEVPSHQAPPAAAARTN